MPTSTLELKQPKVVPAAEWLAARKEHLAKEKEFTRLRDKLSRERRELPWEKVEKQYLFEGPNGKETLADLFGKRSQLIVYHFMFGPGLERGLSELLVSGRSLRWRRPTPGESRRHAGGGFTRDIAGDRSVQEADGLAIQVGIVVRKRFQLRLPCVVHKGRFSQGQGILQLRPG